jgi:wyosine [tRNA(Phe)-imidazoG37] synthetase (radical SAM superfamily)
LGIDLFARKICNLNCVYCEVGPTIAPVCRRGAYAAIPAITAEIDAFFADQNRQAAVDVLTVTAKGEPTLDTGLCAILDHCRGKSAKPVAVLTNGTTLMDVEVRRALAAADIVVPSLDAARPESFQRVDRPAPGMELGQIIAGLTQFSWEYAGQLWLEILLVRDGNDAPEDIAALIALIKVMRLDRIQLNTVARPPAEVSAQPLSHDRLSAIAALLRRELRLPVDVPSVSRETTATKHSSITVPDAATQAALVDEVRQMVRRRPCTAADIARTLPCGGPEQIEHVLAPLVRVGILQIRDHGGSRYYQEHCPEEGAPPSDALCSGER